LTLRRHGLRREVFAPFLMIAILVGLFWSLELLSRAAEAVVQIPKVVSDALGKLIFALLAASIIYAWFLRPIIKLMQYRMRKRRG
jgi:hypothetical protein